MERWTRRSPELSRFLRRAPLWIAIGALLDLTIVQFGPGRQGLASLGAFSLPPVLFGVALAFVPWFTRSLRVRIWSGALGPPLGIRSTLRVVLSGDVLAAVTPTAVGGAPAKAALLYREGLSGGAALTLTALGSLEDGLFFCLSLPLAVWLSPGVDFAAVVQMGVEAMAGFLAVTKGGLGALGVGGAAAFGRGSPVGSPGLENAWIWVTTACLSGVGLLFAAGWTTSRFTGVPGRFNWVMDRLRFIPDRLRLSAVRDRLRFIRDTLRLSAVRDRLRRARHQMAEVSAVLWSERRRLLLTLPLTATEWSARYAVVSCLVLGLGLPVDPFLLYVLQCVVFTLLVLVPSPGATGGAEGVFLLFHSGIAGEQVAVLLLAWRTLTFFLPLGVGAVLLFLGSAAGTVPPAPPIEIQSGETPCGYRSTS